MDEERLKIEYLPIDKLTPYERNTRAHAKDDVDAIALSIKKYGMNDPIGVWSEKNIIVEGHGRFLACKKLRMKEVPVVHLDHMTDEERREYAIMHNKTAELSTWDFENLVMELSEIDLSDFGDDLFNLKSLGVSEGEAYEDDYDEQLPEEPKSKLGDIYKLGRHRLMCGDSTNPEMVKALMGGELADMLLTDPPYGVDYEGGTGMKIENDKLKGEEFLHFLADAFDSADQVMKPGAVFYIWHADSNGSIFRNACDMVGWTVRQCLIWVKNALVMGRQDYQWRHEPCLYGWKEGASHLWASDRKQTTVLEFDKPKKNDIHPTMKPVLLFDYQIKNNTKGGDIVLDLFAGSGTTIVAAEQDGRRGFCMEYDPRYVDAIIGRYEALTGDTAELIHRDGETEEET